MRNFAGMDLLHQISLSGTVVAVGHHSRQYKLEEETLHDDELQIVKTLSPRKQTEWIASRELLYKIINLPARVACLYDDFGKPYLQNSPRQISISHSERWCAAMVSDRACGVDIQMYTPTVRRIAGRFLTHDDLLTAETSNQPLVYLHVLWGAKECLYKAYGKRKLGFREHIFIRHLDFATGKGYGEIEYEGLHLSYEIHFRLLPETAWVFCIEYPAPTSGSHHEL